MVNIKTILKFLRTGYNSCYQVKVKIYDDNNLIYCGYSYNGIIELNLKEGNVYTIEASLPNSRLITSFYVCKHILVFNLNPTTNNRTITFQLTDYNYNNLPIMKGEIILV